jgi:hypothetical protein
MKWPWRLGKTCGEICDDLYDFIMGNVVKWCRKLSTAWFFASYIMVIGHVFLTMVLAVLGNMCVCGIDGCYY